MEHSEIMLTIRCITFNHSKYIRECLDGFLMQKTNFAFDVLIHDDASTDGTDLIIKEYADKYPDIIRPLFEKENQYSKYGNLMTVRKQMDPLLRGKYTALCEGDDYWTDPLKLQKQVDFLESHPEYSMCFHQTTRHYQDSDKPDELYYKELEERDYSGKELYEICRPAEASVVMRTCVHQSDVYKKFVQSKMAFGDLPIFLTCAHCGKVHALNENMAVYRIHEGGVSSMFRKLDESVLRYANDNLKIYKIFGDDYKGESISIYVMDHLNFFWNSRKIGKWRFDILLRPLLKFPKTTIKLLFVKYRFSKYHHRWVLGTNLS